MSEARLWLVGADDIRLRLPLLHALRDRGFDVGAVGSESDAPFRNSGIPYWRYSLHRWVSPWSDARSRRELTQLFRAHRPDIVHAFDTKPVILAPLAARDAGVPGRVSTITGLGYLFSSRSPLALALRPAWLTLQRRAAAATGVTIFQNMDDRDYFRRHGLVTADRDAVVYGSGIEFTPLQADRVVADGLRHELNPHGYPVVTMISRLVRLKGVREFLAAAARVRREYRDVVFLLIGPAESGGLSAVSLREVARYAADVRYLGARPDVPALLAISDIFALPSYYREGVPRVLLEAGAMGLPLITTNTPGCREVVRDGWNGLLVSPRNAAALATAMLRLLASPEERREMGNRSRALVTEHFSLQYVANAYVDVYARVLPGGSGTRVAS